MTTKIRAKVTQKKNSKDNCHLTEDKETAIIAIENLMASMDFGIIKSTCLNVISSVI